MKRKTILLILALVLILRETGVITIQHDNAHYKINATDSWSHNNSSIEVSEGMPGNDCEHNTRVNDRAVIVVYKKDSLGQGNECPPIVVRIESIKYDNFPLLIPLYKSTHFSCTVTVAQSFRLTTTQNEKLKIEHVNFLGYLSIEGNVTITGICSYRRANQFIIDKVMQEVYDKEANTSPITNNKKSAAARTNLTER